MYGIQAGKEPSEIVATTSARVARACRDAESSQWLRVDVFGADGRLTVEELNRLADIDHRYP